MVADNTNGEYESSEFDNRCESMTSLSNNWASFALYKDSCVALHSVSAEYLG